MDLSLDQFGFLTLQQLLFLNSILNTHNPKICTVILISKRPLTVSPSMSYLLSDGVLEKPVELVQGVSPFP